MFALLYISQGLLYTLQETCNCYLKDIFLSVKPWIVTSICKAAKKRTNICNLYGVNVHYFIENTRLGQKNTFKCIFKYLKNYE